VGENATSLKHQLLHQQAQDFNKHHQSHFLLPALPLPTKLVV